MTTTPATMTKKPLRFLGVALLCCTGATTAAAATVNDCPIRPATLCAQYDLRAAQLKGADLARADFSSSDLSGADLSGANLKSANMNLVKLNRTNLAGADLESADLRRAEIYGANLRGARLVDANLHSADLNGAALDNAQMRGANLAGAHLAGVSLAGASLERADLGGARLNYADLRGADLRGANLQNAVLTGADFTGARLDGVRFDGARIEGCIACPARVARAEAQPPASPPITLNAQEALPADAGRPDAGRAARAGGGCWARIYGRENFKGEVVTLIGPTAVENVGVDYGFAWEPQFKSLVLGQRAVLTLFDNVEFRDRTVTFKGGQQLADLGNRMGVFRSIRSMRLDCVR